MTRRGSGGEVYLRRHRQTTGTTFSYAFTVPTIIGDLLVARGFEKFSVQLTEEGILYRPAGQALPSWLEKDKHGTDS